MHSREVVAHIKCQFTEENEHIFEFVFMSSTEVTVIEDILLECEIKSAYKNGCYILTPFALIRSAA